VYISGQPEPRARRITDVYGYVDGARHRRGRPESRVHGTRVPRINQGGREHGKLLAVTSYIVTVFVASLLNTIILYMVVVKRYHEYLQVTAFIFIYLKVWCYNVLNLTKNKKTKPVLYNDLNAFADVHAKKSDLKDYCICLSF